MKIKGQVFDKPKPATVILNHGDEHVLFLCGTVSDFSDFDKLCPEPSPPKSLKPGGVQTENVTDKKYLKKVDDYNLQRTYWMIKESLIATPDLEWETVKADDPKTWPNIEKELTKAFSLAGTSRIIQGVLRANGLTE